MGYLVSLEEDQFGNIMNYTHNIKKLVHKLEKCLQSAEADYGEEDDTYEEDYVNYNLRGQKDMYTNDQVNYSNPNNTMNMRRSRGGKPMVGRRRMVMSDGRYDF